MGTSIAVKPQEIREEKAMSSHRQLIAAVRFIPATRGFGLEAPNLFGPARRYLSNEIQKAEIIAMMITHRPILKAAVFVTVLVMWVAALASLVWFYGAGRNNPSPTDLVAMTVLTVVPMVTTLHLALRQVMRPLRPGLSASHAGPRAAIAQLASLRLDRSRRRAEMAPQSARIDSDTLAPTPYAAELAARQRPPPVAWIAAYGVLISKRETNP
jgi:hypothetical protein